MNTIVNEILNIFSGLVNMKFGKELIVFLISILPILELRGGLLAASLLKVPPIRAYIISIIGNILPVPIILLFITKILYWMENTKIKWMRNLSKWIHNKANKNKEQIEKYGYLGLILFIGIPLPGTGAWTGCLIASLLCMDRKKSFLSAMLGILIASVIMMFISYGIIGSFIK